MGNYDIAIVGAGIAGAGLAWALAPHARVLLLEAESVPGYHTTGRSAAFYSETYGGAFVQPLTAASKAFFDAPPEGFCNAPLLSPRGALYIYDTASEHDAETIWQTMAGVAGVRRLDAQSVCKLAPFVRLEGLRGAIYEPGCGHLDVAALHGAYLKGAKASGAGLRTDSALLAARRQAGHWQLDTKSGQYNARVIVNAAGAWADEVARLCGAHPIGIEPRRRTLITVPAPEGMTVDPNWPLVLDAADRFYAKVEGKGFLVSPADETLSPAMDAQPEIEDVAAAVAQFENLVGASVAKVTTKWAGLRSFAPDRRPVIGWDEQVEGLFWSAGQGGWGIQTSPAWVELAAAMVLGRQVPSWVTTKAVSLDAYSPARFPGR